MWREKKDKKGKEGNNVERKEVQRVGGDERRKRKTGKERKRRRGGS